MVANKRATHAKSRQRLTAENMTAAQKVRRDLTGGRPPAPELKTPTSAVTAARMLHRELEARMSVEDLRASVKGAKPEPRNFAVTVAYVSPDLSVLGFSPFYAPGEEDNLMKFLAGSIPLGLIFGIADAEAGGDEEKLVMGARPFFVTAQTAEWLEELADTVRSEIELGER